VGNPEALLVGLKGGIFLSTKRDGMGVGLSSVMAVARKYGGNASFEG